MLRYWFQNKRFVLYVVFVLLSSTILLSAQPIIQTPVQADSLRRVVDYTYSGTKPDAAKDTVRVNTLNALSFYFGYVISQYDSALYYGRKAQAEAEHIGFRKGIAEAQNTIANIYRNQGKYSEALEQSRQSLRLSEELHDKRGIANALNTIGNSHRNQGKRTVALGYFFRALPIAEQLGEKRIIATTYYYISMAYRGLRRFDEALHYCFASLRIRKELNDKRGIAGSLHNLSVIYRVQKKYDEALKYCLQSLEVSKEIGDKDGIASSLHSTAETYGDKGNNAEALHYAYRAVQAKAELGHKEGIAGLLVLFAEVHLRLKNYDSARTYSFRAIALADSIGLLSRKTEALRILTSCYESIGQHKRALATHREYGVLKDSLINLENLNATSALKEGYEAEKRTQQIMMLNNDKALQAVELHQRNVVQWFLVGILMLLVIVAVLLGWLYRQKLRANTKIMKQQNVLEHQAQEIETVNAKLSHINTSLQNANAALHKTNTVLDEANHLKTELLSMAAHDLKNPLAVILSCVEIASGDAPQDDETAMVLNIIQTTAERMNRLIHNLLDSAAMEMGNISLECSEILLPMLVHTIASRYEQSAKGKAQTIIVQADEHLTVYADAARLEQVIDNLVSNAIKYSPFGKTIWLRVFAVGSVARIEVQDEGPGINEHDRTKLFGFFQRLSAQPTGGESSNGVGLALVKKIMDLHGGQILVTSELGKGTTFIVEFPVVTIGASSIRF